jgi:Tfp pilus assembly protein PilO
LQLNPKMQYLFIIGAIIVIAGVLVFIFLHKRKKETLNKNQPAWKPLMRDFKEKSSQIESIQQLETYLSSINGLVKEFETDYAFLIVFNAQIRDIREKLKQKD